mgnify:CR=1 FL=1
MSFFSYLSDWIRKFFTDLWEQVSRIPTIGYIMIAWGVLVILFVIYAICYYYKRSPKPDQPKEIMYKFRKTSLRKTSLSTIDEKTEPPSSSDSQSLSSYQMAAEDSTEMTENANTSSASSAAATKKNTRKTSRWGIVASSIRTRSLSRLSSGAGNVAEGQLADSPRRTASASYSNTEAEESPARRNKKSRKTKKKE